MLTSKRCVSKHSLTRCWRTLGHLSVRGTSNMTALTYEDMRNYACAAFLAGVYSVHPSTLVSKTLRMDGNLLTVAGKVFQLKKPCVVVGFGKAALGMAVEAEKILGDNMSMGIVSVPNGTLHGSHAPPLTRLRIYEGADNNLPDQAAMETATQILDLAHSLTYDDLMLVLISGGGSALLSLPCPPVSLDEKLRTVKLLASAGASIHQLNSVRKRLSMVKGGRLAEAAYPASTVSLILSDVIGDPIDIIASGPTVSNSDTVSAAKDIISQFSLESQVPTSVQSILFSGQSSQAYQKLNADNFVIGNNTTALTAVKKKLEDDGFEVVALSRSIEGFVIDVAQFYATLADWLCSVLAGASNIDHLENFLSDSSAKFVFFPNIVSDMVQVLKRMLNKKGLCLIAGGETTVHVTGNGVGGRNQELALVFAEKINTLRTCNTHLKNFKVGLLSAGTDGIDGPTSAAGAFGCDEQIENNPDYKSFLANNDTHTFYQHCYGGKYMIKTGHTGTNVMDIHILVIHDARMHCSEN